MAKPKPSKPEAMPPKKRARRESEASAPAPAAPETPAEPPADAPPPPDAPAGKIDKWKLLEHARKHPQPIVFEVKRDFDPRRPAARKPFLGARRGDASEAPGPNGF